MTSYEFWEELSKIFNAVVSYQEKSVEFNKRFISPWISIGNVFEGQDRSRDMIAAYKNAIEIAPENAQHWFDLGNLYVKESNYEDAIHAFQRAIELNPDMGWAYSNLGTVYMESGAHEQAIICFERSITLLADPGEKSVSWNRLGNLYRKTQQYSLALDAFQHADELDSGRGVVNDNVVNVAIGSPDPSLLYQEQKPEEKNEEEITSIPEPLMVADAHMQALVVAGTTTLSDFASNDGFSLQTNETQEAAAAVSEIEEPALTEPEVVQDMVETQELTAEAQEVTAAASEVEEPALTEPEVVQDVVETQELTAEAQEVTAAASEVEEPALTEPEVVQDVVETQELTAEAQEVAAAASEVEEPASTEPEVVQVIAEIVQLAEVRNEVDGVDKKMEEAEEAPVQPHAVVGNFSETAYEEFLRNEGMYYPSADLEPGEAISPHVDRPGTDPVTMIDSFGDVKMEVDINNPKVWNELGNVYYKNGAIEDAIVAYAKSIELDRCFAWPYSNLALAYVQKERLAESVLLYQRAIELFNSEKDKAIAWNCLGNVYRRMEDYPNAIAAYQRADALDPNNISTSLQSQYSLLGTLSQPQETISVQ